MRVIYRSLGGLGWSDLRCLYAVQHLMYLLFKKYGSTKTVWDRTEEIYSACIVYRHQIRSAAQRSIAGDEK